MTPDKLATGAGSAFVATSETTTSTSYADLSTPGPAVTVTIGSKGLALVSIYSSMANNTAGQAADVSFAISGATTVAADDTFGLEWNPQSTNRSRYGVTFLVTGLSAGSNIFTQKYRVSGGTGTFSGRRIAVVPL